MKSFTLLVCLKFKSIKIAASEKKTDVVLWTLKLLIYTYLFIQTFITIFTNYLI